MTLIPGCKNSYGMYATVIKCLNEDDPEHMSLDVLKNLYDLVESNQNKPQLKIEGFKPRERLASGACLIDVQYDVTLHDKPLFTVYESDCDDGAPNFYILEFQEQHYRDSDLRIQLFPDTWRERKGMGTMIHERWQSDEKKREAQRRNAANTQYQDFLKQFQSGR